MKKNKHQTKKRNIPRIIKLTPEQQSKLTAALMASNLYLFIFSSTKFSLIFRNFKPDLLAVLGLKKVAWKKQMDFFD